MTHFPVNLVFSRDVLCIVFFLGIGPRFKLMVYFDGNVLEGVEVVGSPYFGEAAFA
jgi:hypothetical protein